MSGGYTPVGGPLGADGSRGSRQRGRGDTLPPPFSATLDRPQGPVARRAGHIPSRQPIQRRRQDGQVWEESRPDDIEFRSSDHTHGGSVRCRHHKMRCGRHSLQRRWCGQHTHTPQPHTMWYPPSTQGGNLVFFYGTAQGHIGST